MLQSITEFVKLTNAKKLTEVCLMGEKKTEETQQPSQGGLFQSKGLMTLVLAVLVVVVAFNQYQITILYSIPVPVRVVAVAAAPAASAGSQSQDVVLSQSVPSALAAPPDMMPKGVPAIYGAELGVKYEDISSSNPNVQLTIDKLTNLLGADPGNVLKGAELQRYVKIGSMIACEYCCGANTMVFPNGQPACGCAHSYAMRGVLGYLIKNHGSEYTDEQLLEEIGKWKVLFFPEPMQRKVAVLQANGIELNYINIASEKYRGAESGAQITSSGTSGASQVGGC